jgi:glycerol-3-phosphate dehydrogenase
VTVNNVSAALDPEYRIRSLESLSRDEFDFVVVGGGVTGAGTALDAASRGFSVALIEMRDWAAGTSSRSGKLIHGGLRYLEQFQFGLVRESLRERRLILEKLSPHLATPIQFIYPFKHRFWERLYVGAGLILYDSMGGAGAVPRHRHISKHGISKLSTAVDPELVTGGLTFYDVQMDDARHTLELVRTAAAQGVTVISGAKVMDLDRIGSVSNLEVADLQSNGERFMVKARHVINATGVWAGDLDELAGGKPTFDVTASKGVHILIPRAKIESEISLFLRAEDSVLFVRAWGRHWLIGTTDTLWDGNREHPTATAEDLDYLLRNLNSVLRTKLTREDIDGVFAGLRPLVAGKANTTSKLSREHAVETTAEGFTTIVGGKYTTYRIMAKDAIDTALKSMGNMTTETRTANIPTLGGADYHTRKREIRARGAELGLSKPQVAHLLGRYGSLTPELYALILRKPDLSKPVKNGAGYLRVEIVYAASNEGALHVDDTLTRRTHISILRKDRGTECVVEVVDLMAQVLGWSDSDKDDQVEHYCQRVAAEIDADAVASDSEALALRERVLDPRVALARALEHTIQESS